MKWEWDFMWEPNFAFIILFFVLLYLIEWYMWRHLSYNTFYNHNEDHGCGLDCIKHSLSSRIVSPLCDYFFKNEKNETTITKAIEQTKEDILVKLDLFELLWAPMKLINFYFIVILSLRNLTFKIIRNWKILLQT